MCNIAFFFPFFLQQQPGVGIDLVLGGVCGVCTGCQGLCGSLVVAQRGTNFF